MKVQSVEQSAVIQAIAPESAPQDDQALLVDLRDVIKNYTSHAGVFPALRGLNLQVQRGEFVAVVGKSGSGKTTLMNMITGIDRPTTGEVYVAGTSVPALTEEQLVAWRGRTIGIIFQSFELVPTLTVLENVMLPMDACNTCSLAEAQKRALHLLEQVEIAEHAYKLPSAISGGQQQRVAIARALANNPDVLIADEPTGNLDSQTADSVFHLLERLAAQGTTILMVTHDHEIARRADRIITLIDGEIVGEQPTEARDAETQQQPETPAANDNGAGGAPRATPRLRRPPGIALRPRWSKVMRDLWGNKMRTLLVVLSIAVGVFAVGMIATARLNLSQGLAESYAATNPASAMLMVSNPFFGGGDSTSGFDDELVEVVRGMREVDEAEGRRKATVRLQVGPNEWRDLQLFAISDYDDIRINTVIPQGGAWPPDDHELLIERAALGLTNAQLGDMVTVKTPSGKLREMQITGLTLDMSQLPSFMDGAIYGYITFDTLEWLGEPDDYNELYITVAEGQDDKDHIQQVAELVRDKVERSGRPVEFIMVPEPGQHILDAMIQAIVLLLGVLGVLSLLLSGFLVVTTISAILTQHVRQIGILKAVGMRRWQITLMYFLLVASFGFLALVLAMPLSALVARNFSTFMATQFNFDLLDFEVPPYVIGLQVGISLLVPMLAALYPVLKGTGVTVREALQSESGPGSYGSGWIDRIMRSIRGVSRPLLLSLRNTFRRKSRLMLTLTTLTLSGAMFITVFCVRDSMFMTLNELMDTWQYDVWVTFHRLHRTDELEEHALRVPGVTQAEGVGFASTRRVRPDNTDSDSMMMFALKPGSELMASSLAEGRWLLPEDENAVVLSTEFVKNEPDVKVGSEIVLKIKGHERTWKVVGLTKMFWPAAYVNYPHFARVSRDAGRANTLWIVTEGHDIASQQEVAQMLEQEFEDKGFSVSSILKMKQEEQEAEMQFNIIVSMLAVMAVLMALVGGLGLMGTMSINVLERTREIGVMRSIGASNGAVMLLVLTEGVMIGLISWTLSVGLALLMSQPLSVGVGVAIWDFPLTYAFSVTGVVMWLVLVLILSSLASFVPAWNASRLTVRDVLAYE